MIVPASAMIHQGSYVMTLLLLFGAAVLTAMFPPAIRWTMLSPHVMLFFTCCLFSIRMSTATPVAWRAWTLVEAGALFAAFLLMLAAVPDSPPHRSDTMIPSQQDSRGR